MGEIDYDDEEAYLHALGAALRSGSVITGTTWANAAPTTTAAAWRALSDPDAPLLGDDLPDLDADDGSTRWEISLEALTARFGEGRTAVIAVPALGSMSSTILTLLEGATVVHESAAEDTLEAMERTDDEAAARGWHRASSVPPNAC